MARKVYPMTHLVNTVTDTIVFIANQVPVTPPEVVKLPAKASADGIKQILELTKFHNDLALKLMAGSIGGIITAKYIQFSTPKANYIHLLFLPVWVCLSIALIAGNTLHRKSIPILLYPKSNTPKILSQMGDLFQTQYWFTLIAICLLAIWLIAHLILFIKKQTS